MMVRLNLPLTLLLLLAACPSGGGGGDESTTAATTGPVMTTTGTTIDTAVPTTGVVPGTSETGAPTTTDGETTGEPIPVPPACSDESKQGCDDPISKCKEDQDRDQVAFACDNAPDYFNPEQTDIDDDGFGDIIDLCPTVASDSNTADVDKDGVGNPCDLCGGLVNKYNKKNVDGVAVIPYRMRVRNVPLQHDTDKDGVGDVCDNCIHVPNCGSYGAGDGLTPYVVGMPVDHEAADCLVDADDDLVGDACAGQMLPGAAGPVGHGDADDFDQDGLANAADACPRQPAAPRACGGDDDCPGAARCTAGRCNHVDSDSDGVGDICDSCPAAANPGQEIEAMAQADDADGDFIGEACEQHAACFERANPRAFAFYDVSAGGMCCVTTYQGAPLTDPDGGPIDVDSLDPRPPGVFDLPPGCEEALTASADGKAHAMKACHVERPSDLWDYFCVLPARDQDFDGVPDDCDLCPHYTWDPGQEPYVDDQMMEYPNYGKWCRGDYDPEKILDPANMCMPKP